MGWKRVLTASLIAAAVSSGVQAAPADWVSPNVPLSSPLYGYIEKFDGLGYLKSMTTGTKPYTRMQMAKWLTEIRSESQQRPLPLYLLAIEKEMERELQPELKVLAGDKTADTSLSLKEVRFEVAAYSGDTVRSNANLNRGPRAGYQPLNINNNGYRYGENGNYIASAWLAGKIGNDTVVALEPRLSYDSDQNGDASLISGYVKTRVNGTAIQVGKDPVFWGHSETGSLILGNNMEPLTSIKVSNLEPYTSRGFLRFLGQMNFTGLYSQLENDRTRLTANEVDKPSFVAFRSDFTPKDNFTFGLSFASMVGGKGKGMSSGDYWHWLTGHNDDAAQDKWNNIAGVDFKVRLPRWNGVQVYGEVYGEDQANYMPSKPAERGGVYIPRLSKDGAWDMRLEYAHTSDWWYSHQLYTNGYVYKGNIIGDPMGHDASQYFVKVGHYLDKNTQISLNASHLTMERSAPVSQTVNSFWIRYQTQLKKQLFCEGTLGMAKVSNADFVNGDDDTDHFASVTLRWVY